jgi:hypothetical protein
MVNKKSAEAKIRLDILNNSADLPPLAGALINSAKHVMPKACVLARLKLT